MGMADTRMRDDRSADQDQTQSGNPNLAFNQPRFRGFANTPQSRDRGFSGGDAFGNMANQLGNVGPMPPSRGFIDSGEFNGNAFGTPSNFGQTPFSGPSNKAPPQSFHQRPMAPGRGVRPQLGQMQGAMPPQQGQMPPQTQQQLMLQQQQQLMQQQQQQPPQGARTIQPRFTRPYFSQ
jgi:hypothetical protein